MNKIIPFFLIFFLMACSDNDPNAIAKEYCNCRTIEKSQGALQGNKCYEEWDKKYGDVKLNEEQQNTFLKVTQACN
jgi:hypothetical protein